MSVTRENGAKMGIAIVIPQIGAETLGIGTGESRTSGAESVMGAALTSTRMQMGEIIKRISMNGAKGTGTSSAPVTAVPGTLKSSTVCASDATTVEGPLGAFPSRLVSSPSSVPRTRELEAMVVP